MGLSSINSYALSTSLVAALLAGCSSNPGTGMPTTSGSVLRTHSATNGKTFYYTGKPQVFAVPNVHSITVVMRGASGEYCHNYRGAERDWRARGARVFAVIPVTPHQKLWVYVGGQAIGSSGGFNGGGKGGDAPSFGFPSSGGGGASDVRVAPGWRDDRILVAGGGGGDGHPDSGPYYHSEWGCAGYGGGFVGGDGFGGFSYYGDGGGGGRGGSQSSGGTGGQGGRPKSHYHGNAGENGRLGIGGDGGQAGGYGLGGGGGGGGYYGGGGGGSGVNQSPSYWGGGGGGGGGSSFAEHSATRVRFWKNWKNATGDGLVVFSWQ